MKAWFEGLSWREQLTMLVGGFVLSLLLIYTLLWAPLSDEGERLQNEITAQQETLAWMKQAVAQIKQSGQQYGGAVSSGESLLTLVDRSAKNANMGGMIKRVQPDKDGRVRIWLENVSFDQMTRWLARLSREHAVSLYEANIEKQEQAALVKARLTLKKGAK